MDQTTAGFNQHFVGREGFVWWIGQIVAEDTWKNNIPGKPGQNNSEQRGFGERYRVRIMGYHTDDCNEVPDDELPWAYVQYPTTAGGGGRSSFCSANLAQGNFVKGYFLDGKEGQIPIIEGVIGNNEYQAVLKSDGMSDCSAFKARSGYLEGEKIASYTVNAYPGGYLATPVTVGGPYTWPYFVEGTLGSNALVDMASWEERKQGKKKEPLAQTNKCDPIPTSRIQQNLRNRLQKIQELRRSLYDYRYALTSGTADIQELITTERRQLCKLLASLLKDIIAEMEKGLLRSVNLAIAKKIHFLHPPEQQELKKEVENVNDQIACVFKRIIEGLLDMVCQFVDDADENVVNTPECFVDNAVGNMLGNALIGVQNGINDIFGGIDSILALADGGLGGGASALGNISAVGNIIQDLSSYLSCEDENSCSGTKNWSIWDGLDAAEGGLGNIQNILQIAQNTADKAGNVGFGDLNMNYDKDEVFGQSGCDTSPRPCGPPVARWISPTGSGAQGNLIISSGGAIIGYDPIDPGTGYQEGNTYGYAYDDCGNGDNGVFYPIVEDGGITDIVVEQGGTDYLPGPNGCTGGDGREWSCENDTDITHPDGSIEVPIPPDIVVEVRPGDIVNTPCCSEVVTEPIDNDPETGGETINGCSQHIVQKPGRFTTPRTECPGRTQGTYPSSADGAYPVILYLCEVIIQEAGVAYQPGDEVVIEPDLGAAAVAEVDEQGRIMSIKVTEGGEGFQELPKIYIRSATGFNSVLLPKFCVYRVGEDEFQNPELQDKIVTVIDCVGRV